MPTMDQKIQEDIIKDTTELFAKYSVDITKLDSIFWGEFFEYIQKLTKEEGVYVLTALRDNNLAAYTTVKDSNILGQVYTDVFSNLG